MPVQSNFKQIIDENLPLIADQIVELYNENREKQPYWFKKMLTTKFSVDNTFASTDIMRNLKSADVVALDSSLPLKSRAKLATWKGELPKVGMKMVKNERDVRNLLTLVAQNPGKQAILESLFDFVPDCTEGVYMRIEAMFLMALSTGIFATDNSENVGTAIRADFGYLAKHKKTVGTKWATAATATPIADMIDIIELAKKEGIVLKAVTMSKKYFDLARKTNEAKMYVAQYAGLNPATADGIPSPLSAKYKEVVESELGVTLNIVDSTIRVEGIDGENKSVEAFKEDAVVFTPSNNVGDLYWGTLAEEKVPVAGVSYTKADQYILLSMFAENDPLREFTSSQAYVMPSINNPSSVFVLTANK